MSTTKFEFAVLSLVLVHFWMKTVVSHLEILIGSFFSLVIRKYDRDQMHNMNRFNC